MASADKPSPESPLGGEQVLYPPQGATLKVVEENHQLVNKDAEQAEGRNLIPTPQGEGV